MVYEDLDGEVPVWAPDTVSFCHCFGGGHQVSENLKVKDAIFFLAIETDYQVCSEAKLYLSEKENGPREARDLKRQGKGMAGSGLEREDPIASEKKSWKGGNIEGILVSGKRCPVHSGDLL